MITLRLFEESDFDQLIAWSADEQTLMQYAGPSYSYPLTPEQLAATLAGKDRLAFTVVRMADGTAAGHAEIYYPNPHTAHLCRLLIGHAIYRGMGIGLEMVKALLVVAFSDDTIVHASLNVYDWNTAAIKCYQKAGFTVCSDKTMLQPVDGKMWTTLHMRITKEQWMLRQLNQ